MKVEVCIVMFEKQSADFLKNLKTLRQSSVKISENDFTSIDKDVIIIDALFGTGLSKEVTGTASHLIKKVNLSRNKVISIDIPSGLFTDRHSSGTIVHATKTLTFQNPKLAFLFPENGKYVGDWEILDIGLVKKFIDEIDSKFFFLQKEDILKILKPRPVFSHKGNFGHSLLICGSKGKAGASILAAKACLRTGTGLLTVHIPKCNYEIIQTAIPEATVTTDTEEEIISDAGDIKSYNAIGVGPGIGKEKKTEAMVLKLFNNFRDPIVIDADALNIISENNELLKLIPASSILTPHPKEFQRLAGESENDFDRFKSQREFSDKYNVIVVLKGAFTCITVPNGKTYFNSTGNPGMAKGGSGDVLTGMITAFVAQGYSPEDAAVAGVYVHGLAGDISAKRKGTYSLIASDLIEKIPNAFNRIQK
jgi:NAD(P)H-hydrate epimerase